MSVERRRAVTADCDVNVGIATTFCGSVSDLSSRAQHAVRRTHRGPNTENIEVFRLCVSKFSRAFKFSIGEN